MALARKIMTPSTPIYNPANLSDIHSVFARKLLSKLGVGFTNFFSVVWCYFCRSQNRLAIFLHHINMVVGIASKKKVGWPYAARIITLVAHAFPFWNFSKMKHPTRTAGSDLVSVTTLSYNSVSAPVLAGGPIPTLVSFFNASPKPLLKGVGKAHFLHNIFTSHELKYT